MNLNRAEDKKKPTVFSQKRKSIILTTQILCFILKHIKGGNYIGRHFNISCVSLESTCRILRILMHKWLSLLVRKKNHLLSPGHPKSTNRAFNCCTKWFPIWGIFCLISSCEVWDLEAISLSRIHPSVLKLQKTFL